MKTEPATCLRVAEDVTELVGETPLLHLRKVVPAGAADVYVKLEYLNPGGSVKDRAAVGMIRRAEREGRLRPGATITEATAGNTGIGLALIGVSRGYHVCVFVPEHFAAEKVTLMRALGAQVIRTPDDEGMEGAIRRAREYAEKTNGFFTAQFENQANPDYHYETTGREIFEQMQGRIDAVVIGAATAGTFTGVARYIKERLPNALAVAVEPQGSVFGGGQPGNHEVEGIGLSWIPKTFDTSLADEIMMVHDDQAFAMVRELAKREGVLAGGSGGANTYGAIQIAKRLGAGKRVVTVIPDSAERYLSKGVFEKA
jgi:cysteine synthase A